MTSKEEAEEVVKVATAVSFYYKAGMPIEELTRYLTSVSQDKDIIIKALLVCLIGAY